MDIKTLLNNLHKEVSCSVCMNTFRDPRLLLCLHSFCLHCLNNILRTSGRHDIITCPECQRESEVPESGSLEDLPTNFRINSLLDVLAIKECDTTGVKCGNCDKKSAQSSYCFHCCAFWCGECITAHNIIRANKQHRVLALKDFEDQDIEDVLKRPAFCPKLGHEKRELEFFCKICKAAICNACALTYHDGHAKALLEEVANERRVQLNSMIESQKERIQTMKNEISNFDKNWLKIQENAAYVERSVQQFADDMIAVIEAKKQKIIKEVKNQAKESLQRLEIRNSENEREIKITERALELAETLLKRSPGAEIIQPNKVADEIIFQQNAEEQLDDPAVFGGECSLEYDFVKNQKLFDKVSDENIGTLKYFPTQTRPHLSNASGKGITEVCRELEANIILTTRNTEGEQCYEERDCVTVEIKNFSHFESGEKTRIQDNKDGTYKIGYFAIRSIWNKPEVSVKVNGAHIRGSPFAVKVNSRQFRPVLSFGQQGPSEGMFNGPWGVAVNDHDEIAVTDTGNHRVQVFSSDGTYLRSFGKKGDKQGEFHIPSGIAFDKNENIVVGDNSNHNIQFFSGQGEYLSQFNGNTSLDHWSTEPSGISVDSDGNIIVADCYDKLIKIFSPSGHLLRKIGEEGSIISPSHCIQYKNYLIVSDRGEHCIKMFDREGKLLNKFGRKGVGNKEFNEPSCLSVDKAGQLIICDKLHHRVQVLEIPSGKFTTKFEIKGKGMGGLGNPVSIAVLSDGRIVVSDFLNHCIQIFE